MSEPRVLYVREGEEAVKDHTRNYLAGLLAGILIASLAWSLIAGLVLEDEGDQQPRVTEGSAAGDGAEGAQDGAESVEAVG